MPPRAAAVPSSCGETDRQTSGRPLRPRPPAHPSWGAGWGGGGELRGWGAEGAGEERRETHARRREKTRTNLTPRGHTRARSAGAEVKGGSPVWEKRGGYLGDRD